MPSGAVRPQLLCLVLSSNPVETDKYMLGLRLASSGDYAFICARTLTGQVVVTTPSGGDYIIIHNLVEVAIMRHIPHGYRSVFERGFPTVRCTSALLFLLCTFLLCTFALSLVAGAVAG
eukprot:GHVS01104196.1.p2 GENE.GHVS01104196.1~~GHVS01104196.1.p2  ORF type:complete len:119 (+),score=16.55 GHVS01104196.1:539-895(+)